MVATGAKVCEHHAGITAVAHRANRRVRNYVCVASFFAGCKIEQ